MKLKVTLITVSFNSIETIRDTIESVLSQTYKDIEYIIIDGGSTDGTLKIVSEYGNRISKVISESDSGIYDAMNKGIGLASGDIIGLLNSDDLYVSTTIIDEIVQVFNSSKSSCVFADLIVVNRQNISKTIRYYDSSYFSPPKFKYGWMPAHPTFFTYRSVYERVGKYSLAYKIASDFEMLIRILYVEKFSYAYYPKIIVKMRYGGISSSGFRRSFLLNSEIVKACRANGIYTNFLMLSLKLPKKFFEYIKGVLSRYSQI